MPIFTFEGVMGSGKTLSACALAYLEYTRGRDVISNVHVNFPYTQLDTQFFVEHMLDQELSDCVMLLDEAYIYLDARTSASKLNKLFTYFIAQTRKRNVDLYVCIHHIDTVDKRLRRAIDVRGTCRYRKEIPCQKCQGEKEVLIKKSNPPEFESCDRCNGYGISGLANITFFDMRTGKRRKIKIHGPNFFPLYDTREVIAVTGKQLNIDEDDL